MIAAPDYRSRYTAFTAIYADSLSNTAAVRTSISKLFAMFGCPEPVRQSITIPAIPVRKPSSAYVKGTCKMSVDASQP